MGSDDEYVFGEEEGEDEEDASINNGNSGDAVSEDNFIASDDDENENSDDNGSYQLEDSEEDEEESARHIPMARRQTRSATRGCFAKTNEKMNQVIQEERMTEREALGDLVQDVDKEFLYDTQSEDDEDDNGKPKSKPNRNANSSLKRKKQKQRKIVESDEEESDHNEGEVESDESSSVGNIASPTLTSEFDEEAQDENANVYYQPEDSQEEEEESARRCSIYQRRTCSATRGCSAKTNEKMNQVIQEERMTEREALGDLVQDVDKKFLFDTRSEDDEDDNGKPKRKPNSSLKARKQKRRKVESDEKEINHNENEVESDESSSVGNPACRTLKNEFDGEAQDESDNGIQRRLKVRPTFFQAKYSHGPSKLQSVKCPSLHDDLTLMDLPKGRPHFCYVTPGGKSRHCYTLDTLYRVAISKHHESGSPSLQFLQPPDFQSPMGDDLIDQIASRFGRGALNIKNSSAYKQMRRNGWRWNRFRDSMGSTDLYCCPLCYMEAYRRQGNLVSRVTEEDIDDDDDNKDNEESEEESDETEADEKHPFSFLDDPMTILESIGFNTAMTFCFHLLRGVKTHMKAVHDVDPSEMKSNNLFKRFQIRASDGLLQHWLNSKGSMNMWAYWGDDEHRNSRSFLDLSRMIVNSRLKGGESGENASSFSLSFPNRAKKVWSKLIDPYLKPQDGDMKDIISFKHVEEDFMPQPDLDESSTDPEEALIEHLREKNHELGNDDASDDLNDSSGSEDSCNSSIGVDSRSESISADDEKSVDSWMEAKLQKPKAAKQIRRSSNDDSDDDSLFAESHSSTANIVSPQRRILDSGDES